MAKSIRQGRRRHLRHSAFDRFRTHPFEDTAGPHRSDATVGFWDREAARLAASATGQTFTTTFAADTLTITTHGLTTGDGPFALTTDGTLPAGLSEKPILYWVFVVDANTLQLTTGGRINALGPVSTFTDDGTGTHTLTRDVTNEGLFHTNFPNRPETIAAATDIDDL